MILRCAAAGRWSRHSPCACAAGGRSAPGSPTRCARREGAPASTRRLTLRQCAATPAGGRATCAAPKSPRPPTGARRRARACLLPSVALCAWFPFRGVGADIDTCCCQRRPSCYNCGEGGHTADECRRERPPLVRNEQQPALNQSAWDYGRGHNSGGADDYRGSRGYDSGNTARCAVLRHIDKQHYVATQGAHLSAREVVMRSPPGAVHYVHSDLMSIDTHTSGAQAFSTVLHCLM